MFILHTFRSRANIPIIEPFNEVDQMLTYQHQDLTGHSDNLTTCTINQREWPLDPQLPGILNEWVTDITSFVRDSVDPDDPQHSSLGEDKKLFLMSYTDVSTATDIAHHLPFTNPALDLMSVHKYAWPNAQYDQGQPDPWRKYAFDHVQDFWHAYPTPNAPFSARKPFTQGELNYWNEMEVGGWKAHIEEIFHNYDVSFHNELWSSAFSGKFAAGTSWILHRIFWWPDALKTPPWDPTSLVVQAYNPAGHFSNEIGDINYIDVGGNPIPIQNRRPHHHFRPLADLLGNPNWPVNGLFDGVFTANKVFDENNSNVLECYYLKDATNTGAAGWVHNRNAWVMNNFYFRSNQQNFLGCVAPITQTLSLSGFEPATEFHVGWLSTRVNSTVHPPDTVVTSDANGMISLDLRPFRWPLRQLLGHAAFRLCVFDRHIAYCEKTGRYTR